MTWSMTASGHHKSDEWRDEEYELLRSMVDAFEMDDETVVSAFNFNGNHVTANSIEDAKAKLAEYDAEESGGTKET